MEVLRIGRTPDSAYTMCERTAEDCQDPDSEDEDDSEDYPENTTPQSYFPNTVSLHLGIVDL